MRTYYRPDDMGQAAKDPTTLLKLKVLEPLALSGNSYKLVFTPGLITDVYVRGGTSLIQAPANLLGQIAADGGGYVDLVQDGHWWCSSGRIYYTDSAAATPQQENTDAIQHFFLPRRFVDPFNKTTTVAYDDPHFLLVIKSTDALPGVLANVTVAINDYRVLQPRLLTDPNGSNAEVRFDALGLVAGSAVYKGMQGDSFATFDPDPPQSDIDNFYAVNDPHSLARALLGTASTRVIYDVNQFLNSRLASPADPTKWLPVFAATLARETHVSDLTDGTQTLIQITFSYSDGFGREIQKKIQAEPGADGSPRWVGSGWTIFNNNGKPVRQYEPFFSQLPKGHQFEFGVQVGVGSILFYDPVDRVVATLHPNQTYEKVVFDPWHQDSWDVNDTVQLDPATDSDVGDFFAHLPVTDYSPTWYQQYQGGTLIQQDAASKAAAHANTPTADYFDTLGRNFLKVLDNGGGAKFPSRVELDIQGNQRTVLDAVVHAGDQGRIVMRYDYDMLQKRIHQTSIEASERWMLNDCTGKSIRSWDSRGHNFRNTYDELRRPTGLFVQGTDKANSDPRTLATEMQYERVTYGEGEPNDQALNLRTRVFEHADQAGIVTNMGLNPVTNQNEAFDFKGNLLRSVRAFIADYTALPNWAALNRAIALTTPDASAILGLPNPDASVILPTYNAANLLETVSVTLRGSAAATAFVANIDYNAKGQRVLVEYGNGTSTNYTYDPATFRLTSLTTTRAGFPANAQTVQKLSYTYDPTGNITHIQDDADIQGVIFFRNQRVEPSAGYTYDPIYRLIQATGREQLGLDVNGNRLPPTATSYNDVPRVLLWPVPTDGNAVGTYTETYQYDPVGNFINFIHRGSNPANPGWTRTYAYNEASPFEAGKVSNRLTSSQVLGNLPPTEPYTYDAHGNVTSMLQLGTMQWDFKDQLYMTQRQAVNATDDDGKQHQGEQTYYVYDASGQRVRKTTQSSASVKIKERLYLGIFELYREWNAKRLSLARETVRVMDDKKYVALVDTKTNGTSLPVGSPPITTMRYQFDNHLGTACLELDEAANVVTYEEYFPYGSTSYQEGRNFAEVSLKRYRYTGKERDEESGFYYHGARYYAPWIGRWTSCDPAGLVDGTNLYQYSHDSPVVSKDTTGLQTTQQTNLLSDPFIASGRYGWLHSVPGYTREHVIPGSWLEYALESKYGAAATSTVAPRIYRNAWTSLLSNTFAGPKTVQDLSFAADLRATVKSGGNIEVTDFYLRAMKSLQAAAPMSPAQLEHAHQTAVRELASYVKGEPFVAKAAQSQPVPRSLDAALKPSTAVPAEPVASTPRVAVVNFPKKPASVESPALKPSVESSRSAPVESAAVKPRGGMSVGMATSVVLTVVLWALPDGARAWFLEKNLAFWSKAAEKYAGLWDTTQTFVEKQLKSTREPGPGVIQVMQRAGYHYAGMVDGRPQWTEQTYYRPVR